MGTIKKVRTPLRSPRQPVRILFGHVLKRVYDVNRLPGACDPTHAGRGDPKRASAEGKLNSGATPQAIAWKAPSEYENMTPQAASQMRIALASIDWKTGSTCPGERLMTLSTSDVAVCCSSASLKLAVRACTSRKAATFSMAITAWSAKVCSSAICLSRERAHLGRGGRDGADALALAQQRNGERVR